MELFARSWREHIQTGLPLAPIAGGVDVKPLGTVAEKFVRITQGRSADYQQGIQGTAPQAFEGAAAAAAQTWQSGVTQAAAEGRFESGVRGSGAKWQRKAIQVGASRFGPGVAAARDDYQTGFEPYHRTLAGLTLDPRGPRGDPANVQRVAVIAAALNQQRRQGAR